MDALEPIAVRRHGTHGPTVVVLHGGPGAPGSAAGLARALAPDFRVLEPLQRRSGPVPLTVSRHVEDLAVIAPKPAVLIGWSWGAMLGLSFAARYPEQVSKLILVGCGTYDETSRALFRQSLDQRLGDAGRRQLQTLKAQLAAEVDPAQRDLLLGQCGAVYMRAESYDRLEEEPGAAGDRLPADDKGHGETWQDVLHLQREGIEPAAFRAISARVLMLHGDTDPHPGSATRDLLHAVIPQLEYVELQRCGHEPWRERQARGRFLAVIRAWILDTPIPDRPILDNAGEQR